MLNKQKIINFKIKNKIIWGLKKIQNQIIKKIYEFNYQDEDIHMSIEKKLFELLVKMQALFIQQDQEMIRF